MAHRGIHIVELAHQIYRTPWFLEQLGIGVDRWYDLVAGRIPWRWAEVQTAIRLLRGRSLHGRVLTVRDIIDPDALADPQRVLPHGRQRQSPRQPRRRSNALAPPNTTKAAVELGARTAA